MMAERPDQLAAHNTEHKPNTNTNDDNTNDDNDNKTNINDKTNNNTPLITLILMQHMLIIMLIISRDAGPASRARDFILDFHSCRNVRVVRLLVKAQVYAEMSTYVLRVSRSFPIRLRTCWQCPLHVCVHPLDACLL